MYYFQFNVIKCKLIQKNVIGNLFFFKEMQLFMLEMDAFESKKQKRTVSRSDSREFGLTYHFECIEFECGFHSS